MAEIGLVTGNERQQLIEELEKSPGNRLEIIALFFKLLEGTSGDIRHEKALQLLDLFRERRANLRCSILKALILKRE